MFLTTAFLFLYRRTKSGREASEPPIGTKKNSQRFSDGAGGHRLTSANHHHHHEDDDNNQQAWPDSRFFKLVTEFVPQYSN